MNRKTILMMGAFDAHAIEFAFLRQQIVASGCDVLAVNTSRTGSTDLFPVDVEWAQVAGAAGYWIESFLVMGKDEVIEVMSYGAADTVKALHARGKFHSVVAMGDADGAALVTAAMGSLPPCVPKVCLTTAAPDHAALRRAGKDVVFFHVDQVSSPVTGKAAEAICEMVKLAT